MNSAEGNSMPSARKRELRGTNYTILFRNQFGSVWYLKARNGKHYNWHLVVKVKTTEAFILARPELQEMVREQERELCEIGFSIELPKWEVPNQQMPMAFSTIAHDRRGFTLALRAAANALLIGEAGGKVWINQYDTGQTLREYLKKLRARKSMHDWGEPETESL